MSFSRWRFGALSAFSCLTFILAVSPATANESPDAARLVFRLQDPSINESSGLAVSRRHRGIVWTHNDGGTSARLLALDRAGRTKAVITLRGIDPFDPEALAPGNGSRGKATLFLGDIGDNRAVRRDISIFRLSEPDRMVNQTVSANWFRLRYPDGPRDAEALLVDPRDGRLWIATKDLLRGGLYRAPIRLSTARTNVLERVGDVPGLITDGAFLPDGRFVLRSYVSSYVFEPPEKMVAEAALPAQEQGESLAVDGEALLVGSEGIGSAVYRVPVPRPSESRVPSTPSSLPASKAAVPGPTTRPDATGPRAEVLGRRGIAAAGAGIVLLLLGTLAIVRRARRGGASG